MSTKCRLGSPDPGEVPGLLEQSLNESLARMKLDSVDLFFLHNMIVPDDAADVLQGTPRSLFVQAVRPALEDLRQRGRIGAWGITGIGVPDAVIETLRTKARRPRPFRPSPTCWIHRARSNALMRLQGRGT